MRFKRVSAYILASLFAVSGCGSVFAQSTQNEILGTLEMDTRSYIMAPGDIYDFKAELDGDDLDQSSLMVWDSREGSVVRFHPIPNKSGVYRITGIKEGIAYIVASYGNAHASIRVEVREGVKQHGEACRSVTFITSHQSKQEPGYASGTYEVGREIPEGEYVLIPRGTSAQYTIRRENSAPSAEQIQGRKIIVLQDGDILHTQSITAYSGDKAPAQEKIDGKYPAGMYLVGRDIPDGVYRLTLAEEGTIGTFGVYSSNKFDAASKTKGGSLAQESALILRSGKYIVLKGINLIPQG